LNIQQWNTLKKCANMEDTGEIPVGLIVDSPWIPGYVGSSTLDYYTIPDVWLMSNLKVKKDFPDVIYIPDLWVEMGMAAEPSGFGCKSIFFLDRTPNICSIISSADDMDLIAGLTVPNPKTDGLMPFILNLYKNLKSKLEDMGESFKIVAARGPMTIASYIMSLTEFLVAIKINPDAVHKLLEKTTTLTINWLEAQAEFLHEVEGIMVLDDVMGFLSKEDYQEFAHPYLKRIFLSFPDCIKIYHNDTDSNSNYEYVEDAGVNIFNFTHKQEISHVRKLVGNNVCLLGNIPPLDVLALGTAEEVKDCTLKMLKSYGGSKGLIASAGGGVSPGTPAENIRAMVAAVKEFNKKGIKV
jgi:MtaA/CmuA family methyltransferase